MARVGSNVRFGPEADMGPRAGRRAPLCLKACIVAAAENAGSPSHQLANENTNRLLRQYFPKGLDLAQHSQAELNRVARQLNERPRKTLDFESPAERFSKCVASTGSSP
jgi:hypothetical protein